MAFDKLVQPLRNLPLFQGLSAFQLTEIARRAERIVFKPGDVLIANDTPAESAVIIVSGEARRISGPDLADSETLPVGSLLGEMGMLVETVHSSTVVAVTSVRALRIQRSEMLDQMTDDAALAQHFVSRISERLQEIADAMRAIDQDLADALATEDPAAAEGTTASEGGWPAGSSLAWAGQPAEDFAALH